MNGLINTKYRIVHELSYESPDKYYGAVKFAVFRKLIRKIVSFTMVMVLTSKLYQGLRSNDKGLFFITAKS